MAGWPRPEFPGDFLVVKYYDLPLEDAFFGVTTTPKLIGRLIVSDMLPGTLFELVYGPIGFWSWKTGVVSEPQTQITLGFFSRPDLQTPATLVTRNHQIRYSNVSATQVTQTVPTINTFFIAEQQSAIFDCRVWLTSGETNQNVCNLSRAIFGIRAVASPGSYTVVTQFGD